MSCLVFATEPLPGFSTLERTARSTRKQKTDQLYQQVNDALTTQERQRLDGLFSDTDELTHWEQLKQEPGKPLLSRLKNWTERLQWLSTLQLSHLVLSGIPPVKVQHFAAEAQTLDVARMKALDTAKRHTLAAALLTLQYAQTLDDITEMFIKRMRQLHHNAKDALTQHRLDNQQRTDELIMTLRDLIVAYQSEGDIPKRFAAMETVIGDHPDYLLEQCEAYMTHDGNNYFPFLLQFYRSHRATLFRLMDALILKSVLTTQPSQRQSNLSNAIEKNGALGYPLPR